MLKQRSLMEELAPEVSRTKSEQGFQHPELRTPTLVEEVGGFEGPEISLS